jgi:hypothetical protein
MEVLEYFKLSFLFLFGDFPTEQISDLRYPYLIFLISTASIGLLCVLLDFAYYKTTGGKSLFNLSYIGITSTLLMFLFWGIGSGIIGFLSVRLELIAFSIQASILMGLGWPLMFPKLYEYAKSNVNEKDLEQSFMTEEAEEPEENLEGVIDPNEPEQPDN